jgi:hypothetical protein
MYNYFNSKKLSKKTLMADFTKLFGKRKDSGIQHLVKYLQFDFTNKVIG